MREYTVVAQTEILQVNPINNRVEPFWRVTFSDTETQQPSSVYLPKATATPDAVSSAIKAEIERMRAIHSLGE